MSTAHKQHPMAEWHAKKRAELGEDAYMDMMSARAAHARKFPRKPMAERPKRPERFVSSLDAEELNAMRSENERLRAFRTGMRVISNIDGKTAGKVTKLDSIGHTMFVLIDGDAVATEWWRGYWEIKDVR